MAEIVIPKLRLAVLCQHIEFDRAGMPYSLVEPLHTVQPEDGVSFPFQPPQFYLYTQLEDALGSCRFTVQMREEANHVVERTSVMNVAFDGVSNRVIPAELTFQLSNIVFPKSGIYFFHVICNRTSLSESRPSEPNPFPAPRLTVFAGEKL